MPLRFGSARGGPAAGRAPPAVGGSDRRNRATTTNARAGSTWVGLVQGWSVIGRAGSDIASVEIEPAGVPPILATTENGWFAGWWPANVPAGKLGAPAPEPDVVVRGYDVGGTLLAEIRP